MRRKYILLFLVPIIQGILLCCKLHNSYIYGYLAIITYVVLEILCLLGAWIVQSKCKQLLVKKGNILWSIIFLIFVDQGIKVLVSRFLTSDISIIPDVFIFHIVKNYYQNALFNFLRIKINIVIICVFKLFLLVLI